MDKMSSVTPVVITKNFRSSTSDIVFYFRAEEDIVEDSKFEIEFPAGFVISSATCLFDNNV